MTADAHRYELLRSLLLELGTHSDLEIRDGAERTLFELENGMLSSKWGRLTLDDLHAVLREYCNK